MNKNTQDDDAEKTVWPPQPDKQQTSAPPPPIRVRENIWVRLLLGIYLPIALGLSAACASYHFHLMHVIQVAHAQRAFEVGANVTLCVLVVSLVVTVGYRIAMSVKWHAEYRNR